MSQVSFNGATVLHVHPADKDAAFNLIRSDEGSVRVTVSENAFPGRIYGFKGAAFLPCFEHRLEAQHAH